jgi:hypothetical protein
MKAIRPYLRDRYACLTSLGGCGAAVGSPCRAQGGSSTQPHAARWEQHFGSGRGRTASRVGGQRCSDSVVKSSQILIHRIQRALDGAAKDLTRLNALVRDESLRSADAAAVADDDLDDAYSGDGGGFIC